MPRSSEAMGRWNGKAWRVNIRTRRAARRHRRITRLAYHMLDSRGVWLTHYFDKTNWEEAPAVPAETVNFHPHKYDQWNSPGTFESTYTEN